jgi:TonB family protein
MPRGEEGSRKGARERSPSIASAAREYVDRQLKDAGPSGIPTGTGRQMGPLFFDPEGADFTFWIQHFKNEVYRNWIVPQPAMMGFRGHVDIEFAVERDGSMTNLKLLKSAGQPALDRAAENALKGSRLLPLPSDFGPPRVTMQVTFYYNEGPSGSRGGPTGEGNRPRSSPRPWRRRSQWPWPAGPCHAGPSERRRNPSRSKRTCRPRGCASGS